MNTIWLSKALCHSTGDFEESEPCWCHFIMDYFVSVCLSRIAYCMFCSPFIIRNFYILLILFEKTITNHYTLSHIFYVKTFFKSNMKNSILLILASLFNVWHSKSRWILTAIRVYCFG